MRRLDDDSASTHDVAYMRDIVRSVANGASSQFRVRKSDMRSSPNARLDDITRPGRPLAESCMLMP